MSNLSAQIEGDLIALLDDFHSLPEVYDNELDRMIATWYSNPPQVWPERGYPYFSPSAATKCPRELYMKQTRAEKDVVRKSPHQSRWAGLGTVFGDYIQRELLAIERNYERWTGNEPRFKFIKNEDGTPLFEEFAKKNVLVEHNGEHFYLYGAPDGIMEYTTDEGESIRVGLEIKSKQQNPSKTSVKSMKKAEDSHEAQTNLYAYMYDCDYYVILYLNGSKRSWYMTKEEYANFPDIRAFCRKITPLDYLPYFEKFAKVAKSIREGIPPELDLNEWGFNDYKTACALSLTDVELATLEERVDRAKRSSLPAWRKQGYVDALAFIKEAREGEAAE